MDFDWMGFLAIFARLFALSLVVQLALESLYRWTGFTVLEEAVKARARGIGLRFPIAAAFSLWLCREVQYDVLAELFVRVYDVRAWSGSIVTALAVSGGTAPFLAMMNKIEAMKERAKTLTAQAVAARNGGGGV